MKKGERVVGVILILIALLVIRDSSSYAVISANDVGAGFFPKWISLGIIFISFMLIASTFKKEEKLNSPIVFVKNSIQGIMITIFYLIFIYLVGFYISTVLYLIGFMWFFKFRKIFGLVLVISLTILFIYGTFEVALKVPLPTGILFS